MKQTRLLQLVLLCALAVLSASCSPSAPREPLPVLDQTPPALVDASPAYLKDLGAKPLASTWDAIRMVYKLSPEKDTPRSMSQAADYLKTEHIVPASWNTDKDSPLHTGQLALLVCNTVGVKGGLMRHALPGSERYAVLELHYLSIMTQTTTDRYVTGTDLISVIRRASEYQKKGVIE